MSFFPSFDTIVRIGSFDLRWYPVLLTTGVLLVYYLSNNNIIKAGFPKDTGDDLFIGGVIFGVIGARLWYCVFYDLDYYMSNPIRFLKTWEGGLAIQGAITGTTIFVVLYCLKNHYSYMRLLDQIFPNILVGQALGRWGNFFNQEAFGRVVSESFYHHWPAFIKDHMFIQGAYQEPTFLYESVLNLIGFFLINFVYKKKSNPKRGDLVYVYLMWYGVVRYIVETFRSDSLMIGNLKMAQVTGLFFAIVGVFGIFGIFRKLSRKPLLIFDFDQTLGNTEPIIYETFEMMFQRYLPEHPFGEEEKKYVLGPTLEQSFEHYGFKEPMENLLKEYREINYDLHSKVKPMPNAKELLEELKKQGYKIAIVSNKKENVVKHGLEVTGLKDYIDVLIGVDQIIDPKPNPEGLHKACIQAKYSYHNCLYVGDVKNDILTAINAQAYALGYNIDKAAAEKLKEAKPNAVITDLMDMLEILKEDHSWTYDLK